MIHLILDTAWNQFTKSESTPISNLPRILKNLDQLFEVNLLTSKESSHLKSLITTNPSIFIQKRDLSKFICKLTNSDDIPLLFSSRFGWNQSNWDKIGKSLNTLGGERELRLGTRNDKNVNNENVNNQNVNNENMNNGAGENTVTSRIGLKTNLFSPIKLVNNINVRELKHEVTKSKENDETAELRSGKSRNFDGSEGINNGILKPRNSLSASNSGNDFKITDTSINESEKYSKIGSANFDKGSGNGRERASQPQNDENTYPKLSKYSTFQNGGAKVNTTPEKNESTRNLSSSKINTKPSPITSYRRSSYSRGFHPLSPISSSNQDTTVEELNRQIDLLTSYCAQLQATVEKHISENYSSLDSSEAEKKIRSQNSLIELLQQQNNIYQKELTSLINRCKDHDRLTQVLANKIYENEKLQQKVDQSINENQGLFKNLLFLVKYQSIDGIRNQDWKIFIINIIGLFLCIIFAINLIQFVFFLPALFKSQHKGYLYEHDQSYWSQIEIWKSPTIEGWVWLLEDWLGL